MVSEGRASGAKSSTMSNEPSLPASQSQSALQLGEDCNSGGGGMGNVHKVNNGLFEMERDHRDTG